MQTSARNQFIGRVKSVKKGAVNAEVVLDISGGDELVAIITNDSVDHLDLGPGIEAYALIKAPWVILTTDDGLRTSARNRLCGVVSSVTVGAVNSEVKLTLAGGRILTAIVTNEAVRELALTEGSPCCALVKASHVLIGVND